MMIQRFQERLTEAKFQHLPSIRKITRLKQASFSKGQYTDLSIC